MVVEFMSQRKILAELRAEGAKLVTSAFAMQLVATEQLVWVASRNLEVRPSADTYDALRTARDQTRTVIDRISETGVGTELRPRFEVLLDEIECLLFTAPEPIL